MTEPGIPNDLEPVIVAVYRGPLDEFVSRRDALAKQLRAAKQRESADRVKALKKPSRMAWVLGNIVHEDAGAIERLAAAINEAQHGADLRAALETVKAAIRDVAAVGARFAVRAAQPLEPNAIVTAVHAVIGDAGAFADMRAGRLVEVPAAGGLDMLTAFTVREPPPKTNAPRATETPKTEPSAETKARDAELAKAARAELRQAEGSLAKARERSEHAGKFVQSAKEKLDAAERALLHAQAEAQARRADLDRAQGDAAAAATNVQGAERAVAAARERASEFDEA
jgi:hypothetical protein